MSVLLLRCTLHGAMSAAKKAPAAAAAPVVAVHAFVSGRVQGVFFRKYTQRKAQSLRLVGWVRNLPDGRVELHAEGPADAAKALLAWCEEEGSPKSKVEKVEATDVAPTGQFSAFDVAK